MQHINTSNEVNFCRQSTSNEDQAIRSIGSHLHNTEAAIILVSAEVGVNKSVVCASAKDASWVRHYLTEAGYKVQQ